MDKKTLSVALLAIGIVILVVSLFADSFGIGERPGFGVDQALGCVVGAFLTAVGLFFAVDMFGNNTANISLLVIGIGLLAVSLLADVIGIGDDPGFGNQQMMGTIAGVVITAFGLFIMLRAK